jgi:dihydrofolate synthase/folylpolyglutamate synthase
LNKNAVPDILRQIMATTKKTTKRAKTGTRRTKGKKADATIHAGNIRTFPTAIKALLDRPNIERLRPTRIPADVFKLERMQDLLEALGNPHQELRAVHIAGTVGKGSTTAMLDAMLRGCGWATGAYTSPHLIDIRERIMINGEQIGRADFTTLTQQVVEVAERVASDASFFELITAMSFVHFAQQAVDISIIETGLGGRLDATNLITPSVSLITKIDLDHQYLLGETTAEIAREKAGIFKPGVPAISVKQTPEVEAALREVAEEVGSELRIISKEIDFSSRFCVTDDLGAHMRICLRGERNQYMHLPVPLAGEHQADNCGLALSALDVIGSNDSDFDESAVFRGLAETSSPGRMDMCWQQPRIIVDGAHNPASMRALMREIGAHVPFDSMICIFGCNADKDVNANLEMLAQGSDKIIFTKASDQPRAVDPDELCRRFEKLKGRTCQTAPTITKALEIATNAASRDDLICVTGSFYLVGETMGFLRDRKAARKRA